jgi:hypothetical protein
MALKMVLNGCWLFLGRDIVISLLLSAIFPHQRMKVTAIVTVSRHQSGFAALGVAVCDPQKASVHRFVDWE